MQTIFKNRSEAGKKLVEFLLKYKEEKPLVLAIPRGGVSVGFEIAKELECPLDTLVVGKIGAPQDPEFGLGAIAPHVLILDKDTIDYLKISLRNLSLMIKGSENEMERRIKIYRSGEYVPQKNFDTIIITDDGLATGYSARAAVESVRKTFFYKNIIFASPVCPRQEAQKLGAETTAEVICLDIFDNLLAISDWYQNFEQLTDKEVLDYLEKANKKSLKK
jgi:predicted phosphoribosyltransferase